MININPYLNFMGKTEAAMNFYKRVFGGEFTAFQRFSDSPGYEKMPKHEHELMMHVALPLGRNNVLMATDALESMGQSITPGNNMYISINAESEEEAERLFQGLSAGGKIEMPLARTFWGAYFGICIDTFNVQWMINHDPKLSPVDDDKRSSVKNQ